MGRRYGGLVREQLQELYSEITDDIVRRGADYDAQLESARLLAASSSADLNELLKGMSERA